MAECKVARQTLIRPDQNRSRNENGDGQQAKGDAMVGTDRGEKIIKKGCVNPISPHQLRSLNMSSRTYHSATGAYTE